MITDQRTNEDAAAAPRWNSTDFWRGQPRRRLFALGAIVLIATGLVLYLVLKGGKKEDTQGEATVVSVKVASAQHGPIQASSSAIGTIWPREQATVSAKVASQIKNMGVVKNRVVKAGDVVATLEDRDLRAQRAEAASTLEEARLSLRGVMTGSIPQTAAQDEKALRDARATLANATAVAERRRRLFQQGGISQKDVEASELAVTTAENDLKLAESTAALHRSAINPNDRAIAEAKVAEAESHLANLDTQISYTRIVAPISGVITDQFQYQGEYASPGGKLFNIADMSRVIVKTPFADEVASQLKKGDPATVRPTDNPQDALTGAVSLISRSGDPSNRSVDVWIDLANPSGKLRAMGSAQVTVQSKDVSDAVTVPVSAVSLDATTADSGSVMVVDAQSVAHEVKVTVGIRNKDAMQITAGLKGGETVVVEGNYALPDGTKVKFEEAGDKEPGESKDEDDK